jgi:NADH-quinone oxidoreductase subunit N
VTILQFGQASSGFGGMVIHDGFSFFLNILFLTSGLAGIALAYDYIKRMEIERGEYYILLLFSICGMMLMSQANDLIVVFLALELLSIPLYVLAGFAHPRLESEEASLKYFLMGAFAGGFVVFGIALVFGATGTTNLSAILKAINSDVTNIPLLTVGAALILVGLGFKVAAVPFHMWTPDVYHGAPSAVTAFMSVGAKAGGFAALLRIFISAFPSLSADMTMILWVISALTMFLGNVVAIAQSNIKRLLAYSSIMHSPVLEPGQW